MGTLLKLTNKMCVGSDGPTNGSHAEEVLRILPWEDNLIGKYFGLASHAEGLLGGSIPNFSIVRPTVLDLAQWAPQLIRKNLGLAEGFLEAAYNNNSSPSFRPSSRSNHERRIVSRRDLYVRHSRVEDKKAPLLLARSKFLERRKRAGGLCRSSGFWAGSSVGRVQK
ncbi:unnamed protein product [Nesidiocoris tenuis]|uniref:Uncharacterized protein n=1 Tax=Nesidiocoris tenuis TaxID=355587 RepID=A0A6H5G6C4_9HEMI|nr:unnamed protein product [Nesidiocoris tenuis]